MSFRGAKRREILSCMKGKISHPYRIRNDNVSSKKYEMIIIDKFNFFKEHYNEQYSRES